MEPTNSPADWMREAPPLFPAFAWVRSTELIPVVLLRALSGDNIQADWRSAGWFCTDDRRIVDVAAGIWKMSWDDGWETVVLHILHSSRRANANLRRYRRWSDGREDRPQLSPITYIGQGFMGFEKWYGVHWGWSMLKAGTPRHAPIGTWVIYIAPAQIITMLSCQHKGFGICYCLSDFC